MLLTWLEFETVSGWLCIIWIFVKFGWTNYSSGTNKPNTLFWKIFLTKEATHTALLWTGYHSAPIQTGLRNIKTFSKQRQNIPLMFEMFCKTSLSRLTTVYLWNFLMGGSSTGGQDGNYVKSCILVNFGMVLSIYPPIHHPTILFLLQYMNSSLPDINPTNPSLLRYMNPSVTHTSVISSSLPPLPLHLSIPPPSLSCSFLSSYKCVLP